VTIGEEEHEGSLIDLAGLLSNIVRTYENKSNDYVLEKYAEKIKQPTFCEITE